MASVRSATSYQVTIGDTTFKQPEQDGLESLILEDHVDMVASLTVRVAGSEHAPSWNFEIGQAVEARLGTGSVLLFKGEIVALEPSWSPEGLLTQTIRCYDNTHRLARGRKTRWFEEKTDSDIAQSVGAECGLEVECDPTDEKHAYTLQRNESNYTFLKRLAARNNFLLAVDEGKLIFKKANAASTPTKIQMGGDSPRLRSLKLAFNTVEQVTEVIARGWDIREKKEIVGRATTSDVESIGGGDVGAQVSSSKFGQHTAYITDVPFSTQSQANILAKSEMNRLARQFGRGSATVDGNDALRAGSIVEFEGLNRPHNGKYYILSSRHLITPQNGYLTEITFCSNTSGT